MKKILSLLLAPVLLLSGCGKQVQAVPPTAIPTIIRAATEIEASETPASIPATPASPEPIADPTLFGALGTGEIQAYALESVANAIFKKAMDGLVAAGRIQEYQVTSVKIFPGSNGLLAEIIFNVRTTDPGWIADGGTPADDNWLNGQCYRLDFITTETEYQLKNQRLCS
jgi:hypothetical protein